MQPILIAIHVITCIMLVITVLLQQGKGAEVGAVFGSSEAIFGAAGPATLLSKVTTACAIVFMLTSLSLTYLSIQNRGESVMRNVQQVPVAPPELPDKMLPATPIEGKSSSGNMLPGTAEKMNTQSAKSAGGEASKVQVQKGIKPASQNPGVPAAAGKTEDGKE